MERVLVLNQSYEPISIIGWQKAVVLYTLGKVEIVRDCNRTIRSKYLNMKAPSVVRLLKGFHRPRKRIKFNRQNILARDRWRCQYCGKKYQIKELTYDHVVPRAKGGTTCWENIVTCCTGCNAAKGGRTPQEAGMRLFRHPARPDWIPILAANLAKKTVPEEWKDFCFMFDEENLPLSVDK
jgi:5-methylcytosine-specific restriction endonuclease McrA